MAPARKKRLISANELSWRAVPLPDRLDDAEGFFGLEEIDDVEIIADPETKRLQFRALASDTAPSEPESEFSGFDDQDHSTSGDQERPASSAPKDAKKVASVSSRSKAKAVSKSQSLSKPTGFSALAEQDDEDQAVDVSEWANLGLSPDSLTALSRMGFSKPTPIQVACLPEIMRGHDVIGKASTGSGKTLAYGLPVLESFLAKPTSSQDDVPSPSALILAPTRELAHQISKHLIQLSNKLPSQGPRCATITGGLSVHKQQRLLKDADVIVATPGRLWEVMNSQASLLTSLRQAKFLVVDEADRLLSEGHFQEVEEILNSLDRRDVDGDDAVADKELQTPTRQTLVFSATFQQSLQRKLANRKKPQKANMLSNDESMEWLRERLNFREDPPKYIDVNPVSQMAANLREGLIECGSQEKDLYLYALLILHPKTRTLVFTNSNQEVRRITPFLQQLGLTAQAFQGGMPQKARLRAIERFSEQPGNILIASDAAARGLDIPKVELVIHYHVSFQADTYVHRSGRTARAENAGSSVILCAPSEVAKVRQLVAEVHAKHAATTNAARFIRTLNIDRQVIQRLKERTSLAKRITDSTLAKERHNSESSKLSKMAEELGVEYDSDEFAQLENGRRGRGKQRKEKEARDRGLSKHEVGQLKAELKDLLARRINVGVSEKYLSAGGLDVDKLMKGEEQGQWLGDVEGLEWD